MAMKKTQTRRKFIGKAAAVAAPALFPSALPGETLAIRRRAREQIGHLWLNRPKWLLNGMGLNSIPAVPIDLSEIPKTIRGLVDRINEFLPAIEGLSRLYTIGGVTAPAHEFLFPGLLERSTKDPEEAFKDLAKTLNGKPGGWKTQREVELQFEAEITGPNGKNNSDNRASLSLEDPSQWTISWTNYCGVYKDAQPLLNSMALSLTDVGVANARFWPTIANHGLSYNLLILQKVTAANISTWREGHQAGWNETLESAFRAGALFVIDMSIFEHMEPEKAEGCDRVTPSTTTFLVQSSRTKALTPVSIRVSIHDGPDTFYVASDRAWLYALQAAKVSITVWGIWLGHVYHWHIITAAMQMTMYNTLPKGHSIYQLLEPQSKHLIGFDEVLLLGWKTLGPPTSMTSPWSYLKLNDHFARGRNFFDDDPKQTLKRHGIEESDFSVSQPWDAYPLVRQLLRVWDAAEAYVSVFVQESYPDDSRVAEDSLLQAWIQKTGARNGGNVRGLPEMNSCEALKDVLTSYVYRVTVHGATRLNPSLNPVQSFVANYPPCLQKTEIPSPGTSLTIRELLEYLPNTGSIGQMTLFYYMFVFSSPYEPFLPENGVADELFFAGGPEEPRNAALIRFRKEIDDFIHDYDPESPQRFQWPMSVET